MTTTLRKGVKSNCRGIVGHYGVLQRKRGTRMDNENAGNAIGSTEPSVEDEAHWTPEMQALAERDAQPILTPERVS